jgi:osmotically-inducible protein OsmY
MMVQATRPDMDVRDDIYDMVAHYPPLQSDRHHFTVEVSGGNVTLSGHVKSPITERYFADRVKGIRGVLSVNHDRLYNEEEILLEVGRRIAKGVIANTIYGTVILTGTLPQDKSGEAVVNDVAQVAGVQRVVTQFA